MVSSKRRGAILATALILVGCGFGEDEAERKQTRELMNRIFAGLKVALPASGDLEHFSDPEVRPQVEAAVEVLASNATDLEQHVHRGDAQLGYLARSIAADAREVERTYREERYERSAWLLHQIVENCIACHTRLPAWKDAEVTEGFTDDASFEGLSREPRANLLIATRRFDEALTVLEELLLDESIHLATLLGPLTDYLVVSMRVKGDYERPAALLDRIAGRHDLWSKLRLDMRTWREALPELEDRADGAADLETARQLIHDGYALDTFPGDMTSRAHLVAASGVLERFVADHDERDDELAEAYYLLGVVEARIGRNYWVTPAPFLLSESIRIAPQAPSAEDAYALLERELLRSYEGSDEEGSPSWSGSSSKRCGP